MNYKKTYVPTLGYTKICEIGKCSLNKLEFGIIELDAGEKLPFDTCDKETAFIMLAGHCDVRVNGQVWENIGNRATVTTPVIRAIFCGSWLEIIRALTAALTPTMHGWKTCKERKSVSTDNNTKY